MVFTIIFFVVEGEWNFFFVGKFENWVLMNAQDVSPPVFVRIVYYFVSADCMLGDLYIFYGMVTLGKFSNHVDISTIFTNEFGFVSWFDFDFCDS